MALQTLTTTQTVLPSSTPANTGNGGRNNSMFPSADASPLLILAFMAIGLFIAAMVGFFGYRRIRFGTAFGSRFVERGDRRAHFGRARRGPSFNLDDIPKLWDLWCVHRLGRGDIKGGTTQGEKTEELGRDKWAEDADDVLRWCDIMPISATGIEESQLRAILLSNHPPVLEGHTSPLQNEGRQSRSRWQALLSYSQRGEDQNGSGRGEVRRSEQQSGAGADFNSSTLLGFPSRVFRGAALAQMPIQPDPGVSVDKGLIDRHEITQDHEVVVAVAIAMPSRTSAHACDRAGFPDYVIGSYSQHLQGR